MITVPDGQQVLAKLMNKDLLYTELLNELKFAQTLVTEAKTLSTGLQKTINTLKAEAQINYLKYENLPDYVDTKILKEYLRVGTNRVYELVNSPGFPKPVHYANGKNVFAKAEVKEWLEKQKGKALKIVKSTLS